MKLINQIRKNKMISKMQTFLSQNETVTSVLQSLITATFGSISYVSYMEYGTTLFGLYGAIIGSIGTTFGALILFKKFRNSYFPKNKKPTKKDSK